MTDTNTINNGSVLDHGEPARVTEDLVGPTINTNVGPLDTEEAIYNFLMANESSIFDALARRSTRPNAIDLYEECRWIENPTIEDFDKLYRRFGYARRANNILPDESWKVQPEIYDEEETEETEFEKALKVLVEKRKLFSVLKRLDRLCGIGAYGGLLIGTAGRSLSVPAYEVNDSQQSVDTYIANFAPGNVPPSSGGIPGQPTEEPATLPVPVEKKPEKAKDELDDELASDEAPTLDTLLYLRPLSQKCLKITSYEMDPTNPRYGMPVMYSVTSGYDDIMVSGSTAPMKVSELSVHWTHIVHVPNENIEESEVFATPRMMPILNFLSDLEKVVGGSSEMYWKGGYPGFAFETPADQPNVRIDVQSIKDNMELWAKSLKRYMLARGGTIKMLGPQIADATSQATLLLTAIALTIGVPLRVLMGSEQGKLAADQDSEAFDERIHGRRIEFCTDTITRPVLDRLVKLEVLPEPKDQGYNVDWPDPSTPNKLEQIDYAERWVRVITMYISSGLTEYIEPKMFFNLIVGMDIEEVESMVEQAEAFMSGVLGGATDEERIAAEFDADGNPIEEEEEFTTDEEDKEEVEEFEYGKE